MKLELKERARILYFEGKNYKEITELLGVPKSTLSTWCSDLVTRKKENKTEDRMAEFPYLGYILYIRDEKDGIRRARLFHPVEKTRKTMSYGHYLMAVKERRILGKDEIVVKLEGTNGDTVDEYKLTTRQKHGEEIRLKRLKKCEVCETMFIPAHAARPSVTCSIMCRSEWVKRQPKRTFKKVYQRVCVICEEPFEARSHLSEVCFSKDCRAIVKRESRRR